MNQTRSSKNLFGLLAFALLQVCVLVSCYEVLHHLSLTRVFVLLALELAICSIAFSFYSRKLLTTAITVWLLLLLNFGLTPWLTQKSPNQFITLPKNLNYSFEIIGDAMPGFSGIQNVSTDHLGFRTTTKIDYNKHDAFRIFTIGGSTTEEIYTDDKKTWSAQLESLLEASENKKFEVINAGASGLRAQHHFVTLQQVLPYKPDAAIFLMGINDWNHHLKELVRDASRGEQSDRPFHGITFDVLIRRFDITQSLLWRSGQMFLSRQRITVNDGSYYYNQNHSITRSDIRHVPISEVSKDYRFWVSKIVSLCKSSGIHCIFATQPHAYQSDLDQDLRRRLWMTPPNELYTVSILNASQFASVYNTWLADEVKASDGLLCDVASAIPATTRYLIDDCHFNPAGSKRVAQALKDCIDRYNLPF
jgi:lysophospholipase L1-like esterase